MDPEGNLAFIRLVAVVQRSDEAKTSREGQEHRTEANESAGRNRIFQRARPIVVGSHVEKVAFSSTHFFHDSANRILRDLKGGRFVWLQNLIVFVALENNLRSRNLHFVPFSPHRLDEDRELELTSCFNLNRIGGRIGIDLNGN